MLRNNKYYFDEETLTYKKVQKSKKRFINGFILFMLLFFGISYLGFLIFSQYIRSPQERLLKREIEDLSFHYKLLEKKINESELVLADIQDRDDNIYRSYFNAEPLPEEYRKSGLGGSDRYKNISNFDNSAMVKSIYKRIDIMSKQIVVQSKSLDEIVKIAKEKELMLSSIPAIQPVSNSDLRRIASGFGYRPDPIYKIRKMHYGMDFSAPIGTAIFATADGVIKKVNRSRGSFGKYIVIDHKFGYETLYAHMSKVAVRKRQKVKRGQIIGYVGNTGKSTAPHLHYEIKKNNKHLNPVYFYYNDIPPEFYNKMLEKASRHTETLD